MSERMIDRDLLWDMDFERGTGWVHEVWVYHGCFWVHFGDVDSIHLKDVSVDARTTTRKEFFEKFIEAIENYFWDLLPT